MARTKEVHAARLTGYVARGLRSGEGEITLHLLTETGRPVMVTIPRETLREMAETKGGLYHSA